MAEPQPTMSDQGFIDNIIGPIKDAIGKLKDSIQPGIPGATPVTSPSPLPPWLTTVLGIILGWLLSFAADKYGIRPTPVPIVFQAATSGASASCPCPAVEKK